MSATTRNWIFFWLAALLLAGVARYFGPGRVLFTFGYGQTAKGPPGECRHKLPHSRNRNFDYTLKTVVNISSCKLDDNGLFFSHSFAMKASRRFCVNRALA